MKYMKRMLHIITAYVIFIGATLAWSNPQDIILVPFDKTQHEATVERIYKENFNRPFWEIVDSGSYTPTITTCLLDNTVIGFIAYKDYQLDNTITCYLYQFAIDKSYQRTGKSEPRQDGYGTVCMKRFEELARQNNVATIKLLPFSKGVAHFYTTMLNYVPALDGSPILVKHIAQTSHESWWRKILVKISSIKNCYSQN